MATIKQVTRQDKKHIDTYLISNGMRGRIEQIRDITMPVAAKIEDESLRTAFLKVTYLMDKALEKLDKIKTNYEEE